MQHDEAAPLRGAYAVHALDDDDDDDENLRLSQNAS
jgi:hypothetical protein